jgi:hypothetical protein
LVTAALTVACVFTVMLAGGCTRNPTLGGTAVIAMPARPGFPEGDVAIGVAEIVTKPPEGILAGALYVAV